MQTNIKEYLYETGLGETLYPGKRIVKKLPQPGEQKSHCAVYDWRDPDTLRLEIKAGLSGKDLNRKDLSRFPVSFQAPTYVEFDTPRAAIAHLQNSAANQPGAAEEEEESGEEDEEGSGSGSSSGGSGKKPPVKRPGQMFSAFSTVVEGKIPDMAQVKKLVVMGKAIAQEAFEPVLKILAAQLKSLAIVPVNILAAANAVRVTVATPGGRALSDLAEGLVERADVKYKPKDMFGAGPG